ncbi:hypothetical protein NMY22_g19019 [Coprinellus aureogranulatus]|nr:hypothetical protein NMY22_g19019 [Coprinellus aureogranulatus]
MHPVPDFPELTLRRNTDLQGDHDETEWGFGQILAMLLLFLPLRDLVETILARRFRRQEKELKKREWKEALHLRNVHKILELVKLGADPNVRTEDGWTALEAATLKNDWDAFHILVNASPNPADVNTPFHDGRTALETVSASQNSEGIRALIKASADLNVVFQNGQTALEVAALNENWDIMGDLIRANADVHRVNGDGRTVFEMAALAENWTAVRRLIDANVDVNIIFKGGYLKGQYYIDEKQLSEVSPRGREIRMPNSFGLAKGSRTALEVAVCTGNLEAVQMLISAGADANVIFSDGCTPLEAAVRLRFSFEGDWEVARCLIAANANVNAMFHVGVRRMVTALQAACVSGDDDMINLLLDKGADPNLISSFEGKVPSIWTLHLGSALQFASSSGNTTLVQRLLTCGADPNLKANHSTYGTALQAASHSGSLETVSLLLDWGADPNIKGKPYVMG